MSGVEDAWDALDEGRVEDALALLANHDERDPERWLAEATAWMELGDTQRAEGALRRAEPDLDPDDPGLSWLRGELHLAAWRIDEAEREYGRLGDDPAALERLALCADVKGDPERSDALHARASRLDPDGPPPPLRLTEEEFVAVVEEAAEALPEPFRSAFEEVPVLIDAMPNAEVLGVPEGSGMGPDVLGFFSGVSALDGGSFDGVEQPARMFLFQRNLERAARDREELVAEIRVTLFHELGHALGFDEEGVEGMGLE